MKNKLHFGSAAIHFRGTDYLGHPVILKDYYGKKILLSFFREASCPFCNLRVHELIKAYPEFEKRNIAIIAFFASSAEEINKYAGKQNIPFAIVPDPEMKTYSKYLVHQSRMGMLRTMLKPAKIFKVMISGFFNLKSVRGKPILPSDFLINESQHIYRVYYGNDFGDHLSIEDILNWKKEL